MSLYIPGDLVRVRDDLCLDSLSPGVTREMMKLRGDIICIQEYEGIHHEAHEPYYSAQGWYWLESWLEPASVDLYVDDLL